MVDIRKLRKDKGLTQMELGQIIGVVTQSICAYEKGSIIPSVQVAKALGKELGFKWWEFFEDDN